MYVDDLALNNQQWLICYKTKLNPTKSYILFTLFTQPLRSGRIWHKVNFLSGVLTGFNSVFLLLD